MDAHHDKVHRAREAAGSGLRRYFAYSTILDREAFDSWRLQHNYTDVSLPKGRLAEALELDVVFDFPSRFWGGRVAGLSESPGTSVFGVLFEIPAKDWPVIQHKEGAVTGMCVEREVRVKVDGQETSATAFFTAPNRQSFDGPVSQSFVEAWLRGARSAGLPEAYLVRVGRL